MATLRGRIPSISLADVLQMLHANRNTGELRITGTRQSGVFFLQQGQVIHAQAGTTQGEAAAYAILDWDQGEFEFASTAVHVPVTIQRTVQDLVIEAARTTDTRSHLATIFPDLDRVPWPTLPKGKLTKDLDLPPEAQPLADLMNGYRTFHEIIETAPMTDVAVLEICAVLQGAGRLAVLDPNLTLSAALPKPGFLNKGIQGRMAMANQTHWQDMLGPWGKQHQPCLLSKAHEAQWKAMGPYGSRSIDQVTLVLPGGTKVVPVQFVKGMDDHGLEASKDQMEAWQITEGALVKVRPSIVALPKG